MNDNVPRAKPEAVQVSRYPQDGGPPLFCVEKILTDGTWDILYHSRDEGRAWLLAGQAAHQAGVPLLPDSRWPGRSTRAGRPN